MTQDTPMIRAAERVMAVLRAIWMLIASIALVVLIATFGWLVFGRYVMNVTPTWVEQLALLLICYVAFLGAAVGVGEDTHIGVTLFRDMLPTTAQKVTLIVIDGLLAAFGAIMLFAGITLMRFGWDTMLPMLDIPESFRTLAITSCGALVMLFAAVRGLIRIMRFGSWDPDAEFKEV